MPTLRRYPLCRTCVTQANRLSREIERLRSLRTHYYGRHNLKFYGILRRLDDLEASIRNHAER